ncbi:nusb/rsmb/tim44 [Lucifera butyrica]|uniref:Transcription antitermination protein NusB n=1 Tax=Lucifera butyrica TaxID=1351585 RepID=A0A498R9F3_9FIRM|nr:transcription antitermination factor NusB [Lucifera butyrica]VBB08011.1 nusb/rsmb/tim44 [Lucifera butyrica]
MSRRQAREMALQALFQLDYNQTEAETALESVFQEQPAINEKTRLYTCELVKGTQSNLPVIDDIIAKAAIDWKIDRMTGIDRNISRIAVYEMNFGTEPLPPNVIINEAVELAKSFGTEESSRFVNGILGSLIKKKD